MPAPGHALNLGGLGGFNIEAGLATNAVGSTMNTPARRPTQIKILDRLLLVKSL